MALRILSINIDFRNPGNRGDLSDLAKAHDPDFLVLAESLAGDAEILRPSFPYRASSGVNQENGHGLEILSKYPLSGTRALHAPDSIPMLRTLAETPEGFVEIIAVHLNPTLPHQGLRGVLRSFRQRRDQFRLLLREGGRRNEASLIAGDFNVTPWMPGLPALRRRYRDLVKEAGAAGPTYRYFVPLRLDYVMGKGVQARRAQTLHTPWTDHQGLVVDFDLGPGAENPR